MIVFIQREGMDADVWGFLVFSSIVTSVESKQIGKGKTV